MMGSLFSSWFIRALELLDAKLVLLKRIYPRNH